MPEPEVVVDGNPIEEPQDEVVEEEVVVEDSEEEEVVEDVEDNFVDPKQLPNELQPHWKRMQASYTRKMQGLKEVKDKADLYDQIMSDPENIVQKLAEKAGLSVSKKEKVEEEIPEGGDSALAFIQREIKKGIEAALGPVKQDQEKMKAKQSIDYLNKEYPDWNLYDDIMTDIVKKHPTMAQDLDTLYSMAKSKASAFEQRKAGAQKKSSVVTKPSTAGRNVATTPTKINSLDDAIAAAKKQLGYNK
jgi:hypothetical protein